MDFIKVRVAKKPQESCSQLEELMEQLFVPRPPVIRFARQTWRPSVDVYETAKELVVLVEVSGVRKESIEVTLLENILKISGTREVRMPQDGKRFHQMEIDFGRFERLVHISVPVLVDKAKASYQDGFLEIILPKMPKEGEGKTRIEVLFE